MKLLEYIRKKIVAVKIYVRWRWYSVVDPLCRARAKKLLTGSAPLVVRLHSPGVGLFAHLNWALWISSWAMRNGRVLKIECASPNYAPEGKRGDWLPALLRRKAPFAEDCAKVLTVGRWEHLPMSMENAPFTIADGRDVFDRNFAISDTLMQRREAFKQAHFRGAFIVGLHYRGTDKFLEAPRIAYEEAVQSARRALQAAAAVLGGTPPVLFVASDEARLVEYVKAQIADFRVVMVEGALRSADTQPIHKSASGQGLRKAMDAMLDALLLGEADVLIKTSSGLSGWAPILGKAMPIVILSESFERCACYPDSEIAKHAFHEGDEARAVAAALQSRKG